MRNNINIKGNNQIFVYVLEYIKGNTITDSHDIYWNICKYDNKCIHLFEGDIEYFRHNNDWYNTSDINDKSTEFIPDDVRTSKIKVYIPNHSVTTYKKGVKFAVSVNTWINEHKIDLGSFIFKPSDTVAIEIGSIKFGNNEYHEYVEFDIIDPFYLTYSDAWMKFRNNICKEKLGINNTGSILNVTLYVIDEIDNKYLIDSEYVGGLTNFNFSNHTDFLSLNLSESLDPVGFKLNISMNSEYNWLLNYLQETYNIYTSHHNINFELVIKNKDTIIVGPRLDYNGVETYGNITQNINWNSICNHEFIKTLFSSWNNFEEGWNFVASLVITNDSDEDIFTVISNELPITQEFFSRYINGLPEKIIDITDMTINTYNVVNKIENKIVQIDRPNDSKSNIIQPVFFRVKDSEVLTLHPDVTENICINLDDYKSKVEKFILQIDGCKFDQIGANNYGILFKIIGNKISAEINSGTYYILNEDLELVTSGKYNCIR